MSRRAIFVLVVIVAISFAAWRSQLFTVSTSVTTPQALEFLPAEEQHDVSFDVVLQVAPVGLRRLEDGHGPLVIHYWAPWSPDALDEATALDSLGRTATGQSVEVLLVTFEPFPSVARYVGRHRLSTPVLLDTERELRAALPCPRIPYTYLIDRSGRVVGAQEGPVDWIGPRTIATLDSLAATTAPLPPAATS